MHGKGITDIVRRDKLRAWRVSRSFTDSQAAIAQLGERQTEDLKVAGSIPGLGNFFCKIQ